MLTRTNFLDREMNGLRERLLLMVDLNDHMLQQGAESIKHEQGFSRQGIFDAEKEINKLNKVVQKKVLEILSYEQLALNQVKGLFIFAKISRDLERVGDHIMNVIVIAPVEEERELVQSWFQQFLDNVGKMLRKLKQGMNEGDKRSLKWIYEKEDAEVNLLNRQSFISITESLQLEELEADSGGRLILMSRFFERMADHISNAAKDYRSYLKECHSSISRNSL